MPIAAEMLHPLARALDWLADGVALIGVGGRVLHANATFHAIAQRNDGIALNAAAIRLADAAARTRLNAAIAAALAAPDGGRRSSAGGDFAAPRQDGAPSYLVWVRPLLDPNGNACSEPCALMFVRDPLTYRSVDIGTLREVFGLTEAEAYLAKSLQSGQAPADYARERALSLNTVYTHLRHLKDKAGCKRMTKLLRKLNELHVPLRPPLPNPPPLAGEGWGGGGTAGRPPNGALDGFQPSPMLVTPGLRRLAGPDGRSAAVRPL